MTQVRAHSLVHYAIPHPRPERQYKAFTAKTYSGKMTKHSQRRIRKTIDLFIQISPPRLIFNEVSKSYQKFQLSFITLTISCSKLVTPAEGYKNLLAPFLRKMRTLGHVSYVWKGEFQKRGQPHWHITSNAFIHHTWVRNTWNNLQSKHGYLDEYYQQHGHHGAPSTEIRSVKNLARVDMYLAKYISKEDKNGTWQGKIWGCSDNLRKGHQFSFSTTFLDDDLISKGIETNTVKIKRFDTFSVTTMENPKLVLTDERRKELAAHLLNIT